MEQDSNGTNNGKQVAIDFIRRDISEIKASVRDINIKLDDHLLTTCAYNHREVDKRMGSVENRLYYIFGGLATFIILLQFLQNIDKI